ncbi:MAG: response regulator transcription factor [Verrucomicrobia bacterium]|nr:response regulator transcription factor [Verrucomicrobiota bacterium]
MRVLLVEDSARLQQTVGTALRRSGYAVDVSGDGEDGLWRAENTDYDVLVLDLMLPKLDGWSVLERLRATGRSTHVLLLTARDTVQDRVHGLRAGADDYLVKPFALEELLARVEALCRRAYGSKQNRLVVADLAIDTAAKKVTRAGQPVKLKPREYQLLEYLARRRGEVVTQTEIEAHLYDADAEPMSNVVESVLSSLRRKLAEANPAPLIHTRRGLGYVLEGEAP